MGIRSAVLANQPNEMIRPVVGEIILTLLTTSILLTPSQLSPITDPYGMSTLTSGIVLMCSFRVTDSLDILREERNRTIDERDAFDQFATRVNQLTPESPQLNSPAPVATTLTYKEKPPSTNTSLNSVCQLYRETVMDTDHYEEDYGDRLPPSVAAEFGADLANALLNADALTQSLQKSLVNAGIDAANDRKTFQTALTHEIEELTTAQRELRELTTRVKHKGDGLANPTSFETLIQIHEEVQQVEEETEALLQELQITIAEHPKLGEIPLLNTSIGIKTGHTLYSQTPWTCALKSAT